MEVSERWGRNGGICVNKILKMKKCTAQLVSSDLVSQHRGWSPRADKNSGSLLVYGSAGREGRTSQPGLGLPCTPPKRPCLVCSNIGVNIKATRSLS